MSKRTLTSDGAKELPHLLLRPPDDPLAEFLSEVSLLLVKHPIAAQAAFAALLAEGRRFATTPEGERWKAALAGSELVRRGHALWEGSLLKVLEDSSEAVMPTAILEAIVQAISRQDITDLLHKVLGHGLAVDS